MAEFYSVEYQQMVRDVPPGRVYAPENKLQDYYFTYTQAANGTAEDTILLRVLPPMSAIDMFRTWFQFSGWTATATLDIGWQSYTAADGTAVAADDNGLLDACLLTADGAWVGGMKVIATPDDHLPVVGRKFFNNKTEVVIFATIGVVAPGAADILNGSLAVIVA